MPAFQLIKPFRVILAHCALRAKKKGTEVLHTTDVTVSFEGANTDLLPLFGSELLDMYYRELGDGEAPDQGQLAGIDSVSSMPVLRSTSVRMPVTLANEWTGYRTVIDRGLGVRGSNIEVHGTTIKLVRLWLKEGGTVKGELHLQATTVSGEQVGELRDMLKLETKVQLFAPKLQADIGDESDVLAGAGRPHGAQASKPAKRDKAKPTTSSVARKIAHATKGGKTDQEQLARERATEATAAFLEQHGGAAAH